MALLVHFVVAQIVECIVMKRCVDEVDFVANPVNNWNNKRKYWKRHNFEEEQVMDSSLSWYVWGKIIKRELSEMTWLSALLWAEIVCQVTTCSHPCDLLSSDHLLSPLRSTVQSHPCDLLSSDHLLSSLWSTVQSHPCDLLSSDHLLSSLWSTVQWPPALTPEIYCPVSPLWSSVQWPPALTPVIYCPVSPLWSTVQSWEQVVTGQ